MKKKTNNTERFHTAISTRHVFIKDGQVFLKKDTHEAFVADTNVPEWFPTDFQWTPINH